jgi:hypothetical protein
VADRLDLPPALREAIARDLRPLAPLPPPWRRIVGLVPVALALLVAAAIVFGLRRDAPRLGVTLTWIASTAQMLLGLLLTAAALREAVPGTPLSRRIVGALAATAAIAIAGITTVTWMASPTRIAPGFVRYVWSVCVAGTIVSALPVLAIAGWLVARAFPLRPRLAGALYGVGAGLIADAGWRLFCHFSDPLHVFGAHTLGVLAVMGIGAAAAHAGAGSASSQTRPEP